MENQIIPLVIPEGNRQSRFSDIRTVHAGIRTTHYDAIIKWYEDKLDFRLIRKWTSGEILFAFIAAPNDNNFIIEIYGDNTATDGNSEINPGYDHLCFSVKNLDDTIEELIKRNISIVRKFDSPSIGKRVAFIADPFGNKIEFSQDIK